ncbi:M28 family metallopeptidase [Foetidibacter luteolus]|uniref:M28 family metallopeptidase n=1 Tax=Foetidibacter luteolus TaxID=2608880 RepID=UPI00129AAE9B|nr:M28 family peptidase [Foetidibacter luteolus]
MKKSLLLPFAFLLLQSKADAQDSIFARNIVGTLTSEAFWGRGYTKDGMAKAAIFLKQQFQQLGLQPLDGKDYFQQLSYPANTFPGKMEVTLNDKVLEPGKDFIVSPDSRGVKMEGQLFQQDSSQFVNPENRVVIILQDKLTWSVAQKAEGYTIIMVDKHRFTETPASVKVAIENKVIKSFKASNVCGMVKGKEQPDSLIFITAHYDHLGGMGSGIYFPGANDNASGISLLLTLAKYYAAHPQKYSIGFICFAGEEAGLVGSKYYTEHPLLPLQNIRFLLNTDLSGTGEEGIMVVNATEFPNEFAALQKLNNMEGLLSDVKSRGKAANSDHYWFTEKGVPAFFFYTLGGIKAYHDVFDKSATLPLNEINDLNALIKSFVAYLNGKQN